jgi:hypothetical protein
VIRRATRIFSLMIKMRASASEIQSFQAKIACLSTSRERVDAIDEMVATREATKIAAALPSINQVEKIDDIVASLADAAPASLDPVMQHLSESPLSLSGKACALALGEVGFNQGPARDQRIVAALNQAVEACLTAAQTDSSELINQPDEQRSGMVAASPAIAAILSCASAAPVPEAIPTMIRVLRAAESERDPYLWPVTNALEVIHRTDPDRLKQEWRNIRDRLSAESPVRQRFEWFMAEKHLR